MRRETSPVEGRSGIVSNRVVLVLVASCVGAAIALFLGWVFLFAH